MHTFINSPWQIASLKLPHRLIQGPLAGYSCAPFRELFYQFTPPAYCVTEMSSAFDIVYKHSKESRFLYRSPLEHTLAYQISGNDPRIMTEAASILEAEGADLIDINCGCPKTKIRKKGAGSALLDTPELLVQIVQAIHQAINIPLTLKIRIQGDPNDLILAKKIEQAGADALIVHGRRWIDDYDVRSDLEQIGQIKRSLSIPVIANGDISSFTQLSEAVTKSGCDGFMISRAGSGRPWLYQELLEQRAIELNINEQIILFMQHLKGLAQLEDEYKAVLQSKSLIRYYFKNRLNEHDLNAFYKLNSLETIHLFLLNIR